MTGPLVGRVVLVTRPREQAGELTSLLREHGAVVLEAPAIVLEPPAPGSALDEAIRDAAAGAYEWIVFTSASGVEAWFAGAGKGTAGHPRARIAAVGSGTADALRGHGRSPDLVPSTFTTAALGKAFPEGRGRVLLARADIANDQLEAILRSKGWDPVRVDAYRVVPASGLPEEVHRALDEGRVDAVTFTSASTVEGFLRLAGDARDLAVACIGPVTADAARRAGLSVDAVADPHTVEGLVGALERVFSDGGEE
jgi:uroporphyrinogen-III synthase